MRILVVIDDLKIGGAQKLTLTLAQQARAHKVKITVASLSKKNALEKSFNDLGVNVVKFPAKKLFTPSRLRDLTNFIKKGRFSLIHTHLTYANILAGIAGKFTRTPVLTTLHSTAVDTRYTHFWRDNLELLILRQAQEIIGVGESVAKVYQPRLRRDLLVLPNAVGENPGISAAEHLRLRSRLGLAPAQPTFISVGRLSPDKGFQDLIEAFQIICKNVPNTALLIVGDGKLRGELTAQIRSLGLEKNIFLLGTRNDVPHLLAASDIYISASHREGLSLSLLEAMMAALPMIAANVGETQKLIGDDAGILITHSESEQLAKAALQVLAMPEYGKKLGLAGLTRARANYGAKQWFEQLMQIYKKTARHKGKQV